MESLVPGRQPWMYLAAIDPNGQLRGKILRTEKVLKLKDRTCAFPSFVLSGDSHDRVIYDPRVQGEEVNYEDIQAKIDPTSLRFMPWDDKKPFCLVSLFDFNGQNAAVGCPRQLLQRCVDSLERLAGLKAFCGIEFEIHLFKHNESKAVGKSDREPYAVDFRAYSLVEIGHHRAFVDALLAATESFGCPVYAFHAEMGFSVAEVSLLHTECRSLADNAVLLPWLASTIGMSHGVRPSFMAKPFADNAGASGHIHLSLVDQTGRNVFAKETSDGSSLYPDVANFSDIGQKFLAGVLHALPDITLMLCPNINSYKRLIHIAWSPASVSWGLQNRLSAVRVIAPPSCPPEDTRLEVRVPGADTIPHYALAALIGAGTYGIEKELEIPVGPRE